jgi:DNA-binding transcriptional ArsR family regulator
MTAHAMPSEPFAVTTAEQLRALSEPTRWGILGALIDGPASVQELSRAMGIPKGTIGHHVKVLAASGLIGVVETKRVRGVEEKRYARLAGKFVLSDQAEDPSFGGEDELALFTMPIRQALGEATPAAPEEMTTTTTVVRARMSPERARRFVQLVGTLAAEFAEGGPEGGPTYGFAAAVYVPGWSIGKGRRR